MERIKRVFNGNTRILYTFSIAEFGYKLLSSYVFSLTSFFLTDIALLSVTATGAIQLVSRILKLIGAPVSGLVIDKQPFKSGKYVPWLKMTAVLMPAVYVALFVIPTMGLGQNATMILIAVAMIAGTLLDVLFYSAYNSTYHGVTHEPDRRAILASSKSIARECGETICELVYPLMMSALIAVGMKESGASLLTCAVFAVLFILCAAFTIRELNVYGIESRVRKSKNNVTLREVISAALKNKALMLACLIMFLYCFRTFMVAPVKVYYYGKVIGHIEYFAVESAFSWIVGTGIVFAVPLFVKHIGTKRIYIISLLSAACCHALIYIFGHSWKAYIFLYCVSEAFINIVSVLTLNLFAMACDYGNWKYNTNYDGINMSLYTTSLQASILCCTVIRTLLLNSVGYVGGDTAVTAEVSNVIISMLSVYPAIFLTMAAVVAMFFPVNDKMYKRIISALKEREDM